MSIDPRSAQVAVLYRFCAQAFRYPEADWLNKAFLDSLFLLLDQLGALKERAAVEETIAKDPNAIETLQIEHTRLFINGVPHVAAPPYGSVYIDKSLQGQFTEKTLTFYRVNGFDLKDDSDLPDYIVHQLEFLSILADKGDYQAETDFLNNLFLPWFPDFKKRVEAEACHPFYPVIVQLIDFFTMEDNEHGI